MQPIRIAAAVLSNAQGEVLLVRKRSSTTYIQPGGKIEEGEDPLAALTREVHEELGVEIDLSTVIPLGTFSAAAVNEQGRVVQARAFSCAFKGTPTAHAEIEELIWIQPPGPYAVPVAPLSAEHILPAFVASRRARDESPHPA